MPLDWLDVTDESFNALLLLERVQLSWFRGWDFPRPEISLALSANPAVAWYLRHKCPELSGWVDAHLDAAEELTRGAPLRPAEARAAEVAVLRSLVDLLVYALDPAVYDNLPFTKWDARELTGMVDFAGKVVIDVGSGTGLLAFHAAPLARVVYAVEPVSNLRDYIRAKAARLGFRNVFAVDGTITAISFETGFADVTMSGHVYGDYPKEEVAELLRVTRPGGTIILHPGSNDVDSPEHAYLVEQGFQWARFIEPPKDVQRKYWKVKEG